MLASLCKKWEELWNVALPLCCRFCWNVVATMKFSNSDECRIYVKIRTNYIYPHKKLTNPTYRKRNLVFKNLHSRELVGDTLVPWRVHRSLVSSISATFKQLSSHRSLGSQEAIDIIHAGIRYQMLFLLPLVDISSPRAS